MDDGLNQAVVKLESPSQGLYVPPMIWAEETRHSPDACLLVFASHAYDPEDYIRDHAAFLQAVFAAGRKAAAPDASASGQLQDAAALER